MTALASAAIRDEAHERAGRPCRIRQWSDEQVCTTCKLRWDTNDRDDERKCPRTGEAME